MSDINALKNRIKDMVLKYEANVSDGKLRLFCNDVKATVQKYFDVQNIEVSMQPDSGGEILIRVEAIVSR